ncbi:8458_t:CDS:2 [Ambispora gerdemannii]|uniref:8458_t:CDS:1 n=1 Tax=Ambispora gerdemannii TaxID=144530 RepID=A0A9N8Z580_9GLOM|nr:8458_t:CDS:2 [Ambispora gerdemannii]
MSDNSDDEFNDECDYEDDARHHSIVLTEFISRLPDISEQVRNTLFDAFSKSSAFNAKVYNLLLDALANPTKGWNLNDYDYQVNAFISRASKICNGQSPEFLTHSLSVKLSHDVSIMPTVKISTRHMEHKYRICHAVM